MTNVNTKDIIGKCATILNVIVFANKEGYRYYILESSTAGNVLNHFTVSVKAVCYFPEELLI